MRKWKFHPIVSRIRQTIVNDLLLNYYFETLKVQDYFVLIFSSINLQPHSYMVNYNKIPIKFNKITYLIASPTSKTLKSDLRINAKKVLEMYRSIIFPTQQHVPRRIQNTCYTQYGACCDTVIVYGRWLFSQRAPSQMPLGPYILPMTCICSVGIWQE